MIRRETDANREAETLVLKKVAQATGETINRMPLMYSLDGAALSGGRIVRYIEVKCRDITFRQYPEGLYLSVNKIAMARLLQATLNIRTDLVVEFTDCIKWCPIDSWNRQRGVFWWGRNPPREGDEDGPTVAYPWDVFRDLGDEAAVADRV